MKQNGYYSQQHKDSGARTAIFLNEDGVEVVVTAVYENDERMKELYKWPDVVCLGRLTKFLSNR